MGIEPTGRAVNVRPNGFEDRGHHQVCEHFRGTFQATSSAYRKITCRQAHAPLPSGQMGDAHPPGDERKGLRPAAATADSSTTWWSSIVLTCGCSSTLAAPEFFGLLQQHVARRYLAFKPKTG
jgi:hypothetical protein